MTEREWLEAECPICHEKYKYISNYKPNTCNKFDCLYKYNHKEALQRIADMKRGHNA